MMERLIALVLGVWVLVSPWFFGASANSLMLWSNTLVGLALILVNLRALFGERLARTTVLPENGQKEKKKQKVENMHRV